MTKILYIKRIVTYKGVKMGVSKASKLSGVPTATIYGRIYAGRDPFTKSIGVAESNKRRTKHGMCKTRVHAAWRRMKARCNNPNHPYYHRYGGRGIKVCARWNTFQNFLADMGQPAKGEIIDRRNNDKGYSPDNCRWAGSDD